MLPTKGRNKIMIIGSYGAGKTSMHMTMWSRRTDLTNIAPTPHDVTYSHVGFIGDTLSTEDYSGSDKTWDGTLADKRRFQHVHAMLFFFDATKTNYELDLKRYERSIHFLTKESPRALVYIFLHKSDTIRGDKQAALKALKLQVIERNKTVPVCQIHLNLKFKYFATSILDYMSVVTPWRMMLKKLIAIPEILDRRLAKFSKISNFDQLVLFNYPNMILVTNLRINPDVVHFTDEECQERARQWCQQMETRYNGSTEDGKQVFVHDFICRTFLVAVSHDDTVTPLFADTNFKSFLRDEDGKLAAREVEHELKLDAIIRQWKIINCPFELNEDMKVKDYEYVDGKAYFKLPEDWAETLHGIAMLLGIDQVMVFSKEHWVLVHNDILNEDRCYNDFEWVPQVQKWLGGPENLMGGVVYEFEDNTGRQAMRINISDSSYLVFIADSESELYTDYIKEYIDAAGFSAKLQCFFKTDYWLYNN